MRHDNIGDRKHLDLSDLYKQEQEANAKIAPAIANQSVGSREQVTCQTRIANASVEDAAKASGSNTTRTRLPSNN